MPTPTPPTGVAVDPENVQVTADEVRAAAQDARSRLSELRERLQVGPPSADPISTAAAQQWQDSLVAGEDSHFGQLLRRVGAVEEWCRRLDRIVEEYTTAESGIADQLQQLNAQV